MRRLTERQRQVLVLHFLEGMTKGEIADVLGVGRSRITQLMQQGLRNLQIELGLEVPDRRRRPACPTARLGRVSPAGSGDAADSITPDAGGTVVRAAGGAAGEAVLEDVGQARRQPADLGQRGAARSRDRAARARPRRPR